jgi:hypothetical protein
LGKQARGSQQASHNSALLECLATSLHINLLG